jgi:hypothetical protein
MISPVTTPVLCPYCAAPFLPQTQAPSAHTTCPECSGSMQVGQCAPAPVPALEVSEWKTQEQRADHTLARQQERQFRGILWLSAGVALIAGILLWRMAKNGSTPAAPDLPVGVLSEDKTVVQSIFASAKAALECPDWQHLHQHVLAPDRVKPLIEWYYKKNPRGYQPRIVTGYERELVDQVHQPATATMRVLTNDGALYVLLQQTAEGWKLDWESFANVYSVLWSDFLKGEEGSPKELPMPLEIEVCPASTLVPSWFAATGFPRDDARRAVRLIVGHPTNVAAACWSSDDPVGREILGALEQAGGRRLKWILQVELVRADAFPPAVRVKAIVQKRWNNPAEPQPKDPP